MILPESLLAFRARDGEAFASYLTDGDAGWIRRLCDEMDRFAGRPRRELDATLREVEIPDAPWRARAGVERLLLGRIESRVDAPIDPPALRERVFLAAGSGRARAAVLAAVAADLAVDLETVERALYADLAGERIVSVLDAPSPVEIARRYNLALAQGFLFRSEAVRVAIEGDARFVVGAARLRGLICETTRRGDGPGATLELSGPLSLFRRTTIYGRALASFLPALVAAGRFRLDAACVVRGRPLGFRVDSRDPLCGDAAAPRRFDSAVERALFRDLRRLAPAWELARETEPVAAGRHLLFPDFTLYRRADPSRRLFVEVVGFWTPDYLARKRRALADARLPDLIVCVDESLGCGARDLSAAGVVPYRKRVDPAALLAMAERLLGPSSCQATASAASAAAETRASPGASASAARYAASATPSATE